MAHTTRTTTKGPKHVTRSGRAKVSPYVIEEIGFTLADIRRARQNG